MSASLLAVAMDFSPGARTAFAQALQQARLRQARLLLVHVIPPLVNPSPLLDDMSAAALSLQLRQGLDSAAREQLQSQYAEQAAGVETEILVIDGDPARELVRLCRERSVDTLFLGSTGLSGLAETIFGSVTAKVARKAPCSVMVVRDHPRDMS